MPSFEYIESSADTVIQNLNEKIPLRKIDSLIGDVVVLPCSLKDFYQNFISGEFTTSEFWKSQKATNISIQPTDDIP
jgi:hypothetical protein